MRLSSHQDFNAGLAGNTAAILRLHQVFPEMEGNTRAANSDLQIEFSQRLHATMGWRADHQDRY